MATKRPTFAKRQREQAAKAKAAAKRDRRLARAEEEEGEESNGQAHAQPQVEITEVLARVDALQEELERGAIDYDEFDERKAALLKLLPIE